MHEARNGFHHLYLITQANNKLGVFQVQVQDETMDGWPYTSFYRFSVNIRQFASTYGSENEVCVQRVRTLTKYGFSSQHACGIRF